MTIKHIVTTSAVLLALAVPAFAQDPDPNPERAAAAAERAQAAQERAEAARERAAERAADRAGRGEGRGAGRGAGSFTFSMPPLPPLPPMPPLDADQLYEHAREAIENSQFNQAIQEFNRLTIKTNAKTDAAMYWKAYSQAKLDMDKEALETVAELSKQFAASPWLKDAKALAVEIQAANGQPVSAELQNDEELKLLALRGLMQADPDKGVPIVEKMLAGGASPRVRDRALFVLSQNRSTRARDVMLNTAKNNSNPDLQRSAIRYLGMMGGADDRQVLDGIYRGATDGSVKRAILNSYFMSGNVDRTVDIAKTEKDGDLRRAAIHNLGVMRPTSGVNTGDALVSIYKSDAASDIKRAVINSLSMQRNAKSLVEIARVEKDASLKRELVQKLSTMKAPEATDYMLELLK